MSHFEKSAEYSCLAYSLNKYLQLELWVLIQLFQNRGEKWLGNAHVSDLTDF